MSREKEETALRKLRESLSDVLTDKHSDNQLQQFLYAQENDVPKAANMFRKSLEWRRLTGADTILQDYTPPEVLKKYFMGGIVGKDKEGAVLIVQACGKMDFRGIMKSSPRADIVRYHAFLNESIFHAFRTDLASKGRETGVLTTIMDMEGYSLKSLWKPGVLLLAELIGYVEANYPGMANHVFIINAGVFFPVAYKILYPFFSASTRETIHILGSNYQTELLKHIDPDQLPAVYGGAKYGPGDDPSCSDQVCYCGEVPHSYYMTLDKTNATELVIHRPKPEHVSVNVDQPGAVLSWQINTDNHEVDFCVIFGQPDIETPTEIVAKQRIVSHFVPECGSVTCERAGTYVLSFDIAFAWARKRQIFYTTKVSHIDSQL